MQFLNRVSYPCSKEKLLDSEIFILKTLNFNLNVPNALTYVETLLEVLGKFAQHQFRFCSELKLMTLTSHRP